MHGVCEVRKHVEMEDINQILRIWIYVDDAIVKNDRNPKKF